jgi:hypothetical protein
VQQLVAEAVDPVLVEPVEVVAERAPPGIRRDDLVDVGHQHHLVAVEQLVLKLLDRPHHPPVVDPVVAHGNPDEPVARGRPVVGLVVEHVDVLGSEEP